MNEIQAGPNDLLDTTDCLEAVGVFKGWKNFFFIIILLCLILLQICFWLVDRGCIQIGPSAEAAVTETPQVEPTPEPVAAPEVEVLQIPVEQAPVIAEPEETETAAPETSTPEPEPITEPEAPDTPAVEPNEPAEPDLTSQAGGRQHRAAKLQRAITWPSSDFLSGITSEQLAWAIRLVNAVLILTASLYCLTLMFSLKVSMHGRLGGINHVSRAFFLSLLMLVLLLPWQMVFGGVVTGAVYSPAELMSWCAAENTEDILHTVLYYLRFSGYGVLIFLLLLLSQFRSMRWAKAILRRLEII
jgi:hypothetical protein